MAPGGGSPRVVALPAHRATAPGIRGFTLLEVMIALAILASALVAASDIVSGALRNHVRATNLEVATLLARGKMVALETKYEWKGFLERDEEDEGTFEEEGHPEVKWSLEVKAPSIEPGPDALLRSLTGSEGGLADLLPVEEAAPELNATQLSVLLQGPLVRLGELIRRGVRRLTLTVRWPEGKGEESFTVVTHMVVLTPGEVQQR